MAYEAMLIMAVLFAAGFLVVPMVQGLPEGLRRAVLQLCLLAVAGVYCVVCWVRGRTLPMKTWGIRVARSDGESLTLRRAIARYLLAVPSVGVAGAGLLWCVLDREKQFLHDRWAGTRLFNAKASTPLESANRCDSPHEK
jgi:uncharacterized RDD family membrane protein YckC